VVNSPGQRGSQAVLIGALYSVCSLCLQGPPDRIGGHGNKSGLTLLVTHSLTRQLLIATFWL
jgi:hypothetical protein